MLDNNIKSKMLTAMITFGVMLLVTGVIFIGQGFYRKNNYNSGDCGAIKNAYVGGDAYNYIINGTYFTGYCVIGGSLIISSFVLMTVGTVNLLNNII